MDLKLIPQPRVCLMGGQDGPPVHPCGGETLLKALDEAGRELARIGVAHYGIDEYPGPLPPDFEHAEGYAITIGENGIAVYSDHSKALFYANQTLCQIVLGADGRRLPTLTIIDWPVLPLRGAHVCYHLVTEFMPHSAPDFEGLLRRIRELAHFKANCLLLEIEAMFPYRQQRLACQLAFTQAQLAHLNRVCAENHIRIMPLVQSIGHNYFVLKHKQYAGLRELPHTRQQYCITNPEVKAFYLDLARQVIDGFPDSEYFHIGADETWNLGKCPRCREAFLSQGMESVYAGYINEVCAFVRARGKKPVLWSDMLELFPDVTGLLDPDVCVMYWNYDIPGWPRPYALQRFTDRFQTIAASAARFGAVNHTMYHYPSAMATTNMLASEAVRNGAGGFITTDWMKVVPYELTMPTLAFGAAMGWHGAGTLAAFELGFGSLYFGTQGRGFAQAMGLLSGLVPYCEDGQMRQPDAIERYDQSGLTMGERIRKYTAKSDGALIGKGFRELVSGEAKEFNIMLTYEKAVAAMNAALRNAEEALRLLEQDRPSRNLREYGLLVLAARTQAHKAKMGLLFDRCVDWLKYPESDAGALQPQLVAELDELCAEWSDLRDCTEKLMLPGTFEAVVKNALEIKFEPEALEWMMKFRGEIANLT